MVKVLTVVLKRRTSIVKINMIIIFANNFPVEHSR